MAATSLQAVAQSAPAGLPENIYHVELVVFERQAYAGEDQEHWPKNVQLFYPPNSVELTNAEALEAQKASDPAQETAPELLPTDADTARLNASPATATDPEAEQVEEAAPGPELLMPLDDEQKILNQSRRAIQRSPQYRVLFHEAWLQALTADDTAPAVVILGGNEYGDHRELSGYVVLSISRYLHVQTDLWLSEFVPNIGQESEHWPELPLTPSQQQQRYDTMIAEMLKDAQAQNSTEQNTWQLPSASDRPNLNLDGLGTETGLTGNAEVFLEDEYSQLAESPYRIHEIVTLRQKRRMRSEELHYLDHPQLGVLIKLVPYEPEQTATNANAQLSSE